MRAHYPHQVKIIYFRSVRSGTRYLHRRCEKVIKKELLNKLFSIYIHFKSKERLWIWNPFMILGFKFGPPMQNWIGFFFLHAIITNYTPISTQKDYHTLLYCHHYHCCCLHWDCCTILTVDEDEKREKAHSRKNSFHMFWKTCSEKLIPEHSFRTVWYMIWKAYS